MGFGEGGSEGTWVPFPPAVVFIRRHVCHSSHSGAQTETLAHRATAGTCDASGACALFLGGGGGAAAQRLWVGGGGCALGAGESSKAEPWTEGHPVGETLKSVAATALQVCE